MLKKIDSKTVVMASIACGETRRLDDVRRSLTDQQVTEAFNILGLKHRIVDDGETMVIVNDDGSEPLRADLKERIDNAGNDERTAIVGALVLEHLKHS
jgi:hypothetical protein